MSNELHARQIKEIPTQTRNNKTVGQRQREDTKSIQDENTNCQHKSVTYTEQVSGVASQ